MHEWRWRWQDFCSSEKKLEGLEHWGWYKTGWILCFLLTALFQLALLILNPADKKFASLGYRLIDTCHFSMNTSYNCSFFWCCYLEDNRAVLLDILLHSWLTQSNTEQLKPVFVLAIGNSFGGGGLYFLLHIGMSPSDVQERSVALTGKMFEQINTRYYPSSKTWNVDIKH